MEILEHLLPIMGVLLPRISTSGEMYTYQIWLYKLIFWHYSVRFGIIKGLCRDSRYKGTLCIVVEWLQNRSFKESYFKATTSAWNKTPISHIIMVTTLFNIADYVFVTCFQVCCPSPSLCHER